MTDRDPILPRENGTKDSTPPSHPSLEQGNGTDKPLYGSQEDIKKNKPEPKTTEKGDKPDPKPAKKFRSNRYATKKTAGQGLMGVSLITSNTAQLKGVLDNGPGSDYYQLIVVLLLMSIFLQVIVGLLLMFIGARESKLDADVGKGTKRTEKLNDVSTLLMFIITMLNAALGAFAVSPTASRTPPSPTVIIPLGNTSTPTP